MRIYDAIIIGGGAVGLSTAYYMKEAGLDVLVIERDKQGNGCSYGNAGYIVPSHFVPLASPGMIAKGIKWMFSPQSPFSITPKADAAMIKWLFRFSQYCTMAHVERSGQILYDLNTHSKELYKTLSDRLRFELNDNGLLMLYLTRHEGAAEKEMVLKAVDMGIDARILDNDQLVSMEPAIGPKVIGGTYYKSDAHMDPAEMMRALKTYLAGNIINESVNDFTLSGKTITTVKTAGNSYSSRNVVVTAGYFSKEILKKLNYNLLLESGKGYSFKVPMHTAMKTPVLLSEAKVAVTPLGGQIQFAGTMQIGKGMKSHTRGKIRGLVNAVGDYLPAYEMNNKKPEGIWAGLRPLSPDGLPYVGKSSRFDNLYIGAGHAMMGISLAPVTGQILTGLLLGEKQDWDMKLLSPDRF